MSGNFLRQLWDSCSFVSAPREETSMSLIALWLKTETNPVPVTVIYNFQFHKKDKDEAENWPRNYHQVTLVEKVIISWVVSVSIWGVMK